MANEQRLNEQNVEVEYMDAASKLQKREEHVAVTGAIYSTVPGFDRDYCFDNEDPEALIRDIYAKLLEISDESYCLEKEKFKAEFETLETLRAKIKSELAMAKDGCKEKASLNKIEKLIALFEKYCREHTVLGFNSGRYDLQLVKRVLYPDMVKRARQARNEKLKVGRSFPRCIARGNKVMAFSTDNLKFLDLMNFIAPGFTLAKFIESFTNGKEIKGKFCYEFARSYDALLTTVFPPKSAFWSTLKKEGISDKDYDECLAQFNALSDGERNMLGFLKAYNVQDTRPMVEAATKMANTYFDEFGLDPFKQVFD